MTNRVITYGTYDLLHIGHINLLRRAYEFGDELYVGISTDKFNEEKKNKICVQPFLERKYIIESIKFVSKVIPEESWDQKISDIKKYNISTFVIGDDWKGKFDFLKDYCNVVYLERTEGISTTKRKFDVVQVFIDSLKKDLM